MFGLTPLCIQTSACLWILDLPDFPTPVKNLFTMWLCVQSPPSCSEMNTISLILGGPISFYRRTSMAGTMLEVIENQKKQNDCGVFEKNLSLYYLYFHPLLWSYCKQRQQSSNFSSSSVYAIQTPLHCCHKDASRRTSLPQASVVSLCAFPYRVSSGEPSFVQFLFPIW